MSVATAVRWWPVVGLAGLVALGLAVGPGSTPLDDWFIRTGKDHPALRTLLVLTRPSLLATVLALVFVTALWRRRWRLAAAAIVTPAAGLLAVRVSKPLFARYKGDALAYPSGHTTTAVVVFGLAVLAVGASLWVVAVATLAAVLAALGPGFTFHYFTDVVGALLLGSALVCLAARAVGLDGCQPRCDLRHSGR